MNPLGLTPLFLTRIRIIRTGVVTFKEYLKVKDNKNVSYRKEIARQYLYHKMYLGWRSGRVCKIFLSSSLITKQNLVVVCHTVWAYVGVPKIGVLEPHSLQLWTVPDPAETRHSLSLILPY